MKMLLKIEGMMCPHCEARVKKALEAVEGVKSAEVSHVSGTALVSLEGAADGELRSAVTGAGYTVVSAEEVL